jgi:hypothetical protein
VSQRGVVPLHRSQASSISRHLDLLSCVCELEDGRRKAQALAISLGGRILLLPSRWRALARAGRHSLPHWVCLCRPLAPVVRAVDCERSVLRLRCGAAARPLCSGPPASQSEADDRWRGELVRRRGAWREAAQRPPRRAFFAPWAPPGTASSAAPQRLALPAIPCRTTVTLPAARSRRTRSTSSQPAARPPSTLRHLRTSPPVRPQHGLARARHCGGARRPSERAKRASMHLCRSLAPLGDQRSPVASRRGGARRHRHRQAAPCAGALAEYRPCS